MRAHTRRLAEIAARLRGEIDLAAHDIDELSMPGELGGPFNDVDKDMEDMRARLGALELRVEVIEGGAG